MNMNILEESLAQPNICRFESCVIFHIALSLEGTELDMGL